MSLGNVWSDYRWMIYALIKVYPRPLLQSEFAFSPQWFAPHCFPEGDVSILPAVHCRFCRVPELHYILINMTFCVKKFGHYEFKVKQIEFIKTLMY